MPNHDDHWTPGPLGAEYEQMHRDDPLYADQAGAFALRIDALIFERFMESAADDA